VLHRGDLPQPSQIKRDAGRGGMEGCRLTMVLEEVISYSDAPHQGLNGLSPNVKGG